MSALIFYDYISYIYISGVFVMLMLTCYVTYLTVKERDEKSSIVFFGLIILIILSWIGFIVVYRSFKKQVKEKGLKNG